MTYLLLFLKKSNPHKNYNLKLNSMDLSGEVIESNVSVDMLKHPPCLFGLCQKEN